MLFPYDNFGPAFTALQQPVSQPLAQPQSAPTTMFGGSIPAFQAHPAPADPAPIFHAIRQFAHVDPIFTAAPIKSLLGRVLDVRG